MSNDSCNTLCWDVSEVNNSITESLAELLTHVLCFDKIHFVNRVGMPLVNNVRNELWLPSFLPVPPAITQFQQNFTEVLLGT